MRESLDGRLKETVEGARSPVVHSLQNNFRR